jgi:pimeloyl-ACP methyl ester carboxylesterase
MRRPKRVTAVLVLLGALLIAPPSPPAEAVSWRPCPENPQVQCGSLSVPLDWAHPGGPRIDLALARRPASDPARRIGSLLFNLGGPGAGGVGPTLEAAENFSPELLERFDLVGFDPRGVAGSRPVLCPAGVPNGPGIPETAEDYHQMIAQLRAYDEDCRRLSGPVFDHVDSASVARDVDAIRAAMGERTISLFTVSYGTLLGQDYAERYPRRLRALVLDSTLIHSPHSPRYFMTTRAATVERAFALFVAWCQGPSSGCSFSGQDVVRVLDDLMAKAERGELEDPQFPGFPLPPDLLATMVEYYVSSERRWPDLDDYLATLVQETPSPSRAAAEPPETTNDAYYVYYCADYTWPIRGFDHLVRLRAALREAAPHLKWSAAAWYDVVGCQGRDIPRRNPQRPYRFHPGLPPALLVNSRHDVPTPYDFAVTVARGMPNSVLLTYEGVAHAAYYSSACARAAIDRYLITLARPAPGASCPAEPITAPRPAPLTGDTLTRLRPRQGGG